MPPCRAFNFEDDIKKKQKEMIFFYSLFIDRILESLYSHHIKKSHKSIVIKLTATKSVIMFSSESHFATSRFMAEDSNMNYY